jgi:hypothetical protein
MSPGYAGRRFVVNAHHRFDCSIAIVRESRHHRFSVDIVPPIAGQMVGDQDFLAIFAPVEPLKSAVSVPASVTLFGAPFAFVGQFQAHGAALAWFVPTQSGVALPRGEKS